MCKRGLKHFEYGEKCTLTRGLELKIDNSLGFVTKLRLILEHLFFKQCLIYMRSSFKKDGFNKNVYFLIQKK